MRILTFCNDPNSNKFEPWGILEPVEWIIWKEDAKMHSLIYGAS